MKKLLAAILAVFYLVTSTGTTIHMHYCMGELADWGLGQSKSEVCNGCGMEKNDEGRNGCCNDEQRFVKNNADQKVVESSFQLMEVMGIAFLPEYAEFHSIQIASLIEENPVSNAPPRSSSIAVYILNRTFLI